MNKTPQSLNFLTQRRSISARDLIEPGPTAQELEQLITHAMRVPDHGNLAPFRLIVIAGEQRSKLGEALVNRRLMLNPNAEQATLNKEAQRFLRAPIVVAVVASVVEHSKIPAVEQHITAGLVAYNLLLGAQALGYGAHWVTGWSAFDPSIQQTMGLDAHELVVAYVHLGSIPDAHQAKQRARPKFADKVTSLSLD